MGGPIDWAKEDEDRAAGPELLSADEPEAPEDASSPRRLGGFYGVALSREQVTEQVELLTVEDARTLLLKARGISISENDPSLVIGTLFGQVLQDYQHLLSQYDQEMATAISISAKATVKAVAVEGTLLAMREMRRSIAAPFCGRR